MNNSRKIETKPLPSSSIEVNFESSGTFKKDTTSPIIKTIIFSRTNMEYTIFAFPKEEPPKQVSTDPIKRKFSEILSSKFSKLSASDTFLPKNNAKNSQGR